MIKVAVFGAAGRMGVASSAAVFEAPDIELVAAVDPMAAGRQLDEVAALKGTGIEVAASPDALFSTGVEVAVDFTVAQAARENLRWCADHGVHAVCGTTGFDETDLEAMREWFSAKAHAVVAANFSIGAALMMRCAELCAPFMGGAEVIELHHDRKRDAPSGTSLETVRRMQTSRATRPGPGRGRATRPSASSSAAPGAGGPRAAFTCTRYGCQASLPTKRSSSARQERP